MKGDEVMSRFIQPDTKLAVLLHLLEEGVVKRVASAPNVSGRLYVLRLNAKFGREVRNQDQCGHDVAIGEEIRPAVIGKRPELAHAFARPRLEGPTPNHGLQCLVNLFASPLPPPLFD